MKPIQVVLDTSVLVAAVRSSQGASFRILQLVGDPRWELNLSPVLLFEYEEVAAIHAKKFWREPERLADLLDFLDRQLKSSENFLFLAAILRDADDDMVFELALAAQANSS